MISRFVMTRRANSAIDADVMVHPDTETGGLLPCRVVGDSSIAPFTIGAGPKAVRTPTRFSPDTEYQQQLLDFAFEVLALNFGGAWHKHPGDLDEPSAYDLKTARHIVTDREWNVEQAVFPIAVVRDGQVRLRAYLMRRSALEFEEIPIEVVSDADPRVVEILSGSQAAKREV